VISTEQQRNDILEDLSAIEDWIYEQTDENVTVFTNKLHEIKSKSDPLQLRLSELTERPQAINSSFTLFNYVKQQMADYAVNRTWIKVEEREKLLKLVEEAEQSLNKLIEIQEKLQAHEEPAITSSQIYEKLRPIAKLSQELAKIRKPIEKPKPKPTTAKKNTTKVNQTEANTKEQDEIKQTTTEEEKEFNNPPGDGKKSAEKETRTEENTGEQSLKDEL
jgi:hypothetical protein